MLIKNEFYGLDELLFKIKPEFFSKLLKNWSIESDREYLLDTLEKLNYPYLKKLKELLEKD